MLLPGMAFPSVSFVRLRKYYTPEGERKRSFPGEGKLFFRADGSFGKKPLPFGGKYSKMEEKGRRRRRGKADQGHGG
jgi:hypothetical protein